MAITARSEKRSSDIVDLEQVLIHFISKNDRSACAIVRGTQREYSSQPLKHRIVKRILVF